MFFWNGRVFVNRLQLLISMSVCSHFIPRIDRLGSEFPPFKGSNTNLIPTFKREGWEGGGRGGGRKQGSREWSERMHPIHVRSPLGHSIYPQFYSGLVFWKDSVLSVDGNILPDGTRKPSWIWFSIVSQLGISLLYPTVQQAQFRSQAEMLTPFLETDRLDRVIAVWSNLEWEVISVLQAFWWGTTALVLSWVHPQHFQWQQWSELLIFSLSVSLPSQPPYASICKQVTAKETVDVSQGNPDVILP